MILVYITPSHEEAAATRPLCYSTTQPLYQGAGKPEEPSQEESLARWSTKLLVEDKVAGSSLEGDVASFSIFILH